MLEQAKTRNIHLVCLPAHTSHILQPMDVGVYGPMKATWRKLLKDYKTSTRAATVTKEVFPSLLHQLWKTSISPEHITAGFRASGLYPINPGAIPPYKIAPSVAITTNGSQSSSVGETPLRTELRHVFAKRLQPSQKQDAPKAKRVRVKLHAEGEALTNDEVMDYLRQQEEKKEVKKKGRKRTQKEPITQKKQIQLPSSENEDNDEEVHDDEEKEVNEDEDTNHCFKCSGVYIDGEEREWVGCDNCYRWYHYKCVGFKRLPRKTKKFVCHLCH